MQKTRQEKSIQYTVTSYAGSLHSDVPITTTKTQLIKKRMSGLERRLIDIVFSNDLGLVILHSLWKLKLTGDPSASGFSSH